MSDNIAHALSGAGGGIISMFLTYPLSTISSRFQVQTSNEEKSWSTIVALKKIIKEEGVLSLYSGLDSALIGVAVTNGVYYYFYEFSKSVFEKNSKQKGVSTFESMVSGAIAGAATVLITNPIWVVNTRMATRKHSLDDSDDPELKQKSPISSFQALKGIFIEDGPFALWQGVVPALILVSNPIIQYAVYEKAKATVERSRSLGSFDHFILGAFSKLVATSITYPYIVIKSRMQLRQSSDDNVRYSSVLDGVRKIIKREGVSGLFKGIQSKLLQSVLTAAILFMAKEALFEYTVRLLNGLRSSPSQTTGVARSIAINVNYPKVTQASVRRT
ncbi:hypothetical protein DSO57_1010198 [Entomophthora muscae]|uniref:Uncharacterized protein n=1 Tax=Entomophthora muscae TaxID=34485 RepID=A0ACC2USW7_9FUNG|nr:hypothetical protein DSO57_1010198 [Entomophthora muscae]